MSSHSEISSLPRISIVTPSLNQRAYLEDAIQSVLQQDYPNFEHIIIDGGSTDGTLEILQRYPHLRWISEADRGQSEAINKGFHLARGDWMAWLNADDYYLPGAFTAVSHVMSSAPQADVLYGNCIFVDERGGFQRAKIEHPFDFGVLLYYGCYIPSTGATFFRRSVIEDGHRLSVAYRIVMDFEYFVRLAAARKVFVYVNAPLAAFRWHETNQSLQSRLRRAERLRVQRDWSRSRGPDPMYDGLAQLFRVKRIARKIFSGAYWKERQLRQFQGQDTRWFTSAEGARVCSQLVES
jgi:glycosyltransferase involved in cell wall biosynthesis